MSAALDPSHSALPPETSARSAPGPVLDRLRASFYAGHTRGLAWRREQIGGLRRMLREDRDALVAALRDDLGKTEIECVGGELAQAVFEARFAQRHLQAWTRPERIGPLSLPGRRSVHREPRGIVLVASPWSHPVGLLLAPLASALAAGNCVVLRPPSTAAHTAALLARLVPRHLDPHAVALVEGDEDTTLALLEGGVDHVFYTGNGRAGRLVMVAAARSGTAITAELVGKSPCLVDADVDVREAARLLARAKFTNAGQTCAAPDYLLVHERREQELIQELRRAVVALHGGDPVRSPSYGRIADPQRSAALAALLGEGEVLWGGEARLEEGYVAPTLLRGVAPDSPLLSADLLGPILPLFPVADMTEAIDFVNDREPPLALYVFSDDEDVQELALEQTRSRGVCVNGIPHVADRALPVGDIGASGVGSHHGMRGFETFSHSKSVLDRSRGESRRLYPAYTRLKTKLLYWRL